MSDGLYGPDWEDRQGGIRAAPSRSGRSEYARDRDRVLYSGAFRTLAGKTQVVAASELGNFHTRLTHSLKVAQLGRVAAARLGLDSDLVEAACLAHDIGHPPFGHAGEKALSAAMDELRVEEQKGNFDGFEGNAQNFRILTYLSVHDSPEPRGLNLTRGVLAAATKYPWVRNDPKRVGCDTKWGAYHPDRHELEWMLNGRSGQDVPVETWLLEWCDDVTYACHDMEDFYRHGLIPLDRLLQFRLRDSSRLATREEPEALSEFLNFAQKDWNEEKEGLPFDRERAVDVMRSQVSPRVFVKAPYAHSAEIKAALKLSVSSLIAYFMDDIRLEGEPAAGYSGSLVVDESRRFACSLLKKLIPMYVIERPGLAGQQHGQKRVVRDLLRWHKESPKLLPADRAEELESHGDVVRAACDHVASLSEAHALRLHARLSGYDSGYISDPL